MNNIEEILINLAYDDLSKPNLSDLDIHPTWLLNIKNDIKKLYIIKYNI